MKNQPDKSKNIWVQRNFVFKQLCVQKVLDPKMLVPKILGEKEFIFGSKIIFHPKYIGSKKNLGPKMILDPNNFFSQKFGSKKMLVQNMLDPQNIRSKKFGQNWFSNR